MAFEPENEDTYAFEAKETSRRIPLGWAILFFGLIIWGIYYLWAYTPGLGGWSQAQDLDGGGPAGMNVLATVVFTVGAMVAAVILVYLQRRPKRG